MPRDEQLMMIRSKDVSTRQIWCFYFYISLQEVLVCYQENKFGHPWQVDQSLYFFATLIEHLRALIWKSPKNLNPNLTDYCLFLYLHGRELANLEHVLEINKSRNAAHIIGLHLNIQMFQL